MVAPREELIQTLNTNHLRFTAEEYTWRMNREILPLLSLQRAAFNRELRERTHDRVTVGPKGSGADFECQEGGINADATIQAALNAAAAVTSHNRATVVLPGFYSFDNPVDVPSGAFFVGSGRGRTIIGKSSRFNSERSYLIGATGGFSTAPMYLSAPTNHGENWIRLEVGSPFNSLPFDDYVLIYSDELWNESTGNSRVRGEMVKLIKYGWPTKGIGGSITAYDGSQLVTFDSGVAGTFTDAVGRAIELSGAANDNYNGVYTITTVGNSGRTCQLYNKKSGLTGTDSNNGAISWDGHGFAIYSMLRDQYGIGNGADARVQIVDWQQDITVAGFEFFQEDPPGTRQGDPAMVGFHWCKNIRVHDIHVRNNDGPGVIIQGCVNVEVDRCDIRDLHDYSTQQQYGYGFLIGGASENVSGTTISVDRSRHGVDSGLWRVPGFDYSGNRTPGGVGIPRGVNITHCTASHSTDAAFSTHAEAENWTFVGCVASNNDNFGYFMRGKGSRILACTAEWCSGGIALGHAASSTPSFIGAGSSVIACNIRHIKNIQSAAADLEGTGTGGGQGFGMGISLSRADHMTVKSNVVEFCDRAGIRLRKRSYHCSLTDNDIWDCNLNNNGGPTGAGIVLDDPLGGTISITGYSGTTVTAVLSDRLFEADLGSRIEVTNCSTGGNNGIFEILTISSNGRTITYDNPLGAATDSGDFEQEGSSYNLIEGNRVGNRPFVPGVAFPLTGERDVEGHIKYGIRVGGKLGGLSPQWDNIVVNNLLLNCETAPILDRGTRTYKSNNRNAEGIDIKVTAGPPTDADFMDTPPDNTIAIDSTGRDLYARLGGSWTTVSNLVKQSEEHIIPFPHWQECVPAAGTTGSYQNCDASSGTQRFPNLYFDLSKYPADLVTGKTRNIYLDIVTTVSATAPGMTMDFRLWNADDSESVNGTTVTIPSGPTRSFLGPLSSGAFTSGWIKPAERRYVIQTKRNGGTAEQGIVLYVAFVVRYE